ncbi:MAG: hypothetical protein IKV85_02245 [Ruminococcus sp.]|nr:hypothetical protein [Ruminococcus sp.]
MQSNKSGEERSVGGAIVKFLRNFVLILLLIVFISIFYNFRNKAVETETALLSDAVFSEEIQGVFIRDESPVTYSGKGVLSYNVADGGKVGIDTVIAHVYYDDAQIARNREIAQLERELSILEKIQNPGTLESAQPASLSGKISESYRALIYNRDKKDYIALKEEFEELLVGMSTYQIATQQVSGFNQQIADINARLAELKAKTDAPMETIKSKESAYFVSYCDGYEKEFTPDKLDKLTAEQISSVTDSRSDEPSVVGKLIRGYNWYLAGVIDNSRKLYNIGDSINISLDSSEEIYEAVIKDIRDSGDASKSVIILECSDFNEAFVAHRVGKCSLIRGSYSGLKVPREAIRFDDVEQDIIDENGQVTGTAVVNSKGVYIMKGEQIIFKKIDVIYEGSNYVLSKIHDTDSSYLALYDDILTETEGDELNG